MFLNIQGVDFDDLTTVQRNAIVNPPTGLLIYNITTNQLEVNGGTPSIPSWEGVSNVANDGKVKINGSGGVKPSYTLTAGVDQIVDYGVAALDLSSSPTNEWPQNINSPTDADIWNSANTTLIENSILGQQHIWRVILNYTGKPTGTASIDTLDVFVRNPLSGFEAADSYTLPRNQSAENNKQFLIATIADGASLPAPLGTGIGYELVINSNVAMTVEVDSITRISLHHNDR